MENVLVVVSRWYGGIHLGPDRFKHINQAGRDALEVGGFLEERERKRIKLVGKDGGNEHCSSVFLGARAYVPSTIRTRTCSSQRSIICIAMHDNDNLRSCEIK